MALALTLVEPQERAEHDDGSVDWCSSRECQELRDAPLPPCLRNPGRRGPIPTRQLSDAFMERIRAVERERMLRGVPSKISKTGERTTGVMKEFLDAADLEERVLYRWRVGEAPTMHEDSADAVLLAVGLLWFDVWNMDTVRIPILRVMTRRKRIRDGQTVNLRGFLDYGDFGPDWDTLEKLHELFEPPMDEETRKWLERPLTKAEIKRLAA